MTPPPQFGDAEPPVPPNNVMLKSPHEYVRPKRRPPPRERITIGRLLGSIFCCAVAFSLVPLTQTFFDESGWLIIIAVLGFAVVLAKYGLEGAAVGSLFAMLVIFGLGSLIMTIFG